MTNPYSPPSSDCRTVAPFSASTLARRSGAWFCVAGAVHLLAINALPEPVPLGEIEWAPISFVVLGVAVFFEFRTAEIIARLLGSFMVIGCFLVPIIACTGSASQGTLSYGRYSTESPPWWLVALFILGSAATFVPPWYMLQRKVGLYRVNPRQDEIAE